MSGGKETPRQKMIGMMYLVLTALLALQVSNSVLDKFVFMNVSLERMAANYEMKNNSTVASMVTEVGTRGNLKEEVAVLDLAKEVQSRTNAVMDSLRKLKERMVAITGGIDEETGALIGVSDYNKVSTMMLQQGRGVELEKMLNDYAIFLGKTTGLKYADRFGPIAKDAKDIPVFAKSPEHDGKRFAELYFENTPTAAGMASISYLETEVMEYERIALKILADSVHAGEVSFTDIFPLIRPESKTVAAGGKYIAEMFIAASSSALSPKFYKDGKELEVETLKVSGVSGEIEIKFGRVEFTAIPGNYDPKTMRVRKTYEALIEIDGKPYTETVEYFVAKPTIVVSKGIPSALWKNCGNLLNVLVPALGASYNPRISASNSTQVIAAGGIGKVNVIPSKTGKVVLTVRNNGALIGHVDFRSKSIPKPSYEYQIQKSAGSLADGVSASKFNRVKISAIPDAAFKEDVPKDARYSIRGVEVKLIRGGDPVGGVKTFKNGNINLSQFGARKGDNFIFTIKRTARINFLNKSENVPVRDEFQTIMVTKN